MRPSDKFSPHRQIIDLISALDEEAVLSIVDQQLANGADPLKIIEDCQEGLKKVGELYEKRVYYLSGLIMGGEIFRGVMELVQPVIIQALSGNSTGTILIGTVQGDIHDIGKNNLTMLLNCYGFSVVDLGVDVPPADFWSHALEIRPDIIGLSGLLTSSYDMMKETIELIHQSGESTIASIPIVIGGNQLNEQVCLYVGADYWVNDAMTGVRLCQKIVQEKKLEP